MTPTEFLSALTTTYCVGCLPILMRTMNERLCMYTSFSQTAVLLYMTAVSLGHYQKPGAIAVTLALFCMALYVTFSLPRNYWFIAFFAISFLMYAGYTFWLLA